MKTCKQDIIAAMLLAYVMYQDIARLLHSVSHVCVKEYQSFNVDRTLRKLSSFKLYTT